MQRCIASLIGGTALAVAAVGATGGAALASPAAHKPVPQPIPQYKMLSTHAYITPPTTAQCEKQLGIACYAPFQYHRAYDMNALYRKGLNGRGQTIVIVDSYGYQNIRSELKVFDKSFGLPAPPHFTIIRPAGKVPSYNPAKRPQMVGWAQETSLDVQYSHAMAPGANILLVETPVAETLGVKGFPQIVEAENYVVNHHLGNVISQSLAAPEQTFPNAQSILRLRSAYKNAAAHGVSVLGATGDAGASGPKTLTPQGFAATYFLHRVSDWPATDPLVTAVGGTQMFLNAKGEHTQPDAVWNDTALFGSPAAGSGGNSVVFAKPHYQSGVSGRSRAVPDISMSAAVNGAALVYLDSGAAQGKAAFYLIGGTSEATPLFAGVVAVADQWAGHGLGLLNPALYKLEAAHAPGLVDVTQGNNTVTFKQGGSTHTVVGFNAGPGYDRASGLGTVDGAKFVPELVAASK